MCLFRHLVIIKTAEKHVTMKFDFLLYLTGLTFLLYFGADAFRKNEAAFFQADIESNDAKITNKTFLISLEKILIILLKFIIMKV